MVRSGRKDIADRAVNKRRSLLKTALVYGGGLCWVICLCVGFQIGERGSESDKEAGRLVIFLGSAVYCVAGASLIYMSKQDR